MMDGQPLYPHGHHPERLNYSVDALYEVAPLSRTEHPVRYYYIDFGISVHIPHGEPRLVLGTAGLDQEVPELSDSVPYDPFKVDIYILGHVFEQRLLMVSVRHRCSAII